MSGGMKLPAGLNPQQEQAMKIQMQYQIQHFHNQGMTPPQIAQAFRPLLRHDPPTPSR